MLAFYLGIIVGVLGGLVFLGLLSMVVGRDEF